MEDMVELLLYVSRFKPMVLEGLPMEELLLFFVTFMGSPDFIHNPYLRSRMIEVSPSPALAPHYTPFSFSDAPQQGRYFSLPATMVHYM